MEHPYSWLFSSGKILNLILRFAIREVASFENKNLSNPFLRVSFQYQEDPEKNEKVELFEDSSHPDLCFVQRNGAATSGTIKAPGRRVFFCDGKTFLCCHG